MRALARVAGDLGFALVLLGLLLAANLILNPARFHPQAWGTLIGLAAPLIGAAVASTPAILSGRGGIDISVGPVMGLVNAVVIQVLFLRAGIASPFVIVPVALAVGLSVGLVNGLLATVLRIQPIVATLGTYLVVNGITLTLLPSPVGPAPEWLRALSGPASILPLAAIAAVGLTLRRLPFHDLLMAVGSDDRAAYAAGVDVTRVRLCAYLLSGGLAAVAGLMMTALIGSADPNIGPGFTLTAIAAVALGGVSLAGGRGSLLGAAVGAIDIFLLQSLLNGFNVSTYVLQVAYGAVLVFAVVSAALLDWRRR